jgi:hypothetical protein
MGKDSMFHQETQNDQNNLTKEEKFGVHTLPYFKTYYTQLQTQDNVVLA